MYVGPEQAVEKLVKSMVIADVMPLMWRHCNVGASRIRQNWQDLLIFLIFACF